MAIVYFTGFDDLTANQFLQSGWTVAFQSLTPGVPDGEAVRFSNIGTGVVTQRTLPGSYGTIIIGFAWRTNGFPTTQHLLKLMHGGTQVADILQLGLGGGASGNLAIANAAGSTVATGGTVITPNIWNYVEVKIVVNGASGSCELKLNGVTEIATTTGNFGSSNIDTIQLYNTNSNGVTSNNSDFDDLYVIDPSTGAHTTYLADSSHVPHVQTIFPNGDGGHSDWTPDTGTVHNTRVNETTPDDDSSYVYTATAGNRDSYTFGDLDPAVTSVKAVRARGWIRKTDAGARTAALVTRQGGTDYDGATQTLGTGYLIYNELWEQNPATSADWTAADVNAAEFGIKLVS